VLRRKLKLEKYALTKPLPPYKGTIKDGKTSQMLKEEETKHAKKRKMETINIKIKQKLESYQELYDSNQNYLRWSKIEDIANRYFNNKSKRPYC
jgi:DNA mismatch repair protein MutS2